MSNVTLSPNMGLTVPSVSNDPGPDWATEINNSLSIIDAHNHALGSGVQINPDGININSDLTFNTTNNAINLRSVRFVNQGSPISDPTDIGCLYEAAGELYYNDASANQVQLTSGGLVNATASGISSGTASASFISSILVVKSATSTPGSIDAATLIVRYPGSYPTPSGNYIAIEAPSSLSTGYAFTLPAAPPLASNTILVMDTAGTVTAALTVDNITTAISGSTIIVKDGGISQAKIAVRAVTTGSATNGGVLISNSSGNFQSVSTNAATVTGMGGAVTVIGNPVEIKLQPAVGGANPSINATFASGGGWLYFVRDGSVIATFPIDGGVTYTPSSFSFMDTPAAGAHTYRCDVQLAASGIFRVIDTVMNAYEIK